MVGELGEEARAIGELLGRLAYVRDVGVCVGITVDENILRAKITRDAPSARTSEVAMVLAGANRATRTELLRCAAAARRALAGQARTTELARRVAQGEATYQQVQSWDRGREIFWAREFSAGSRSVAKGTRGGVAYSPETIWAIEEAAHRVLDAISELRRKDQGLRPSGENNRPRSDAGVGLPVDAASAPQAAVVGPPGRPAARSLDPCGGTQGRSTPRSGFMRYTCARKMVPIRLNFPTALSDPQIRSFGPSSTPGVRLWPAS